MGQIRKRGSIYWVRYYRNGQRIEESSHSTKHEDARTLLRDREGDIAKGVPITRQSMRLTFDDAVKAVIEDYTINGKRSLSDLERRIDKHLKPAFTGRRLSAISAATIRTFTTQRLEAGAAPGEINRELAIIKRAFSLAVRTELYHGRVPKVAMLAERNVRTGFFDDTMIANVIAQLPEALRPVARFAYVTGWRVPSEILTLEWRQVDRASWTIRLDAGTTKNGRGRVVSVQDHQPLVEALTALWAEHEALRKAGTICPQVFQRNGKPIRDMRGAWGRACTRAGYPGKLLHDLRRSAVRNLVRSGVPDTVAMKITGHLTRSIFDRYDITSEADIRDALGKLPQAGMTTRGKGREQLA